MAKSKRLIQKCLCNAVKNAIIKQCLLALFIFLEKGGQA
ncbi:hypothetical protein CHCC20335_0984 [Bacillus paralicheniformis]|nr:hypothetical protein CHCC20335_0984 [Bacillus paralicheniformis]